VLAAPLTTIRWGGAPQVATVPWVRAPRVATAVGAGFALWGLAVGLVPLHDNSFLTHLATGRLIVAHGLVPTHDPYSFTAAGNGWVVESWLASLVYGAVERVAGSHGLQLLHAVVAAGLGALVWTLTRPARQLPGRILAATGALVVGTGYWSPRPLLLALVLFGVVILVAESGRPSPWVLVPVLWLWVNVHGSWPIALAYLGVRVIGRRLDGAPPGRLPRSLGAAALGTAAGVFNPLGVRLLQYPLVVVTHHQAFGGIAEWQPPNWSDPVHAVLAAEVVLALVLLVVRRGTMEDALVTVACMAGAAAAARNVPVAALAITPVLARNLAGLGRMEGSQRGRVAALSAVVLVVVAVTAVTGALQRPAYDLSAYPVHEVTWMQRHGLVPGRAATPDYVGNYLEYRYAARAQVFVDDRVDMFPASVDHAYGVLLHGSTGWRHVLEARRVTAVLWPRDTPLAHLVARDRRWRVVVRDSRWIVAVPVGTSVSAPRVA
jgi:hypothetical protein